MTLSSIGKAGIVFCIIYCFSLLPVGLILQELTECDYREGIGRFLLLTLPLIPAIFAGMAVL